MFSYQSLTRVAHLIRENFAGKTHDYVRLVLVVYNKDLDDIRLYFNKDLYLDNTLLKDELILVCYYAPLGNWKKYYGDEYWWDLGPKRIAMDIKNYTLLYNQHFAVNGMKILPGWLQIEIENLL